MKLKISMLATSCLLVMNLFAQKSGYTISGNLKDLPDGVTFYLILINDNGSADTIDRIKSKNQQFMFEGELVDEGRLSFVKMDTTIFKLEKYANKIGGQTWVRLLLENNPTPIKLIGNSRDWPGIDIQNSSLTKQYDQFIATISNHIYEYNENVKTSKKDSIKIAEARKAYDLIFLKTLESFSNSYIIPLFLLNNATLNLDLKETAYQNLSDKIKYSYYGKRLKQQIVNIRASKNIAIGKVIPDFQIRTPEGKLESVRKIAMQAKYTLIDFWASYCIPCREHIPDMKKVYRAFYDKGFNILSISTDSNFQSWQKALKQENTPWTNGIQEHRESDSIFGLIAIPGYILVNSKAEIVQMDLTSKFFSDGAKVFVKDSKKRDLSGDDLYRIIESLLGKRRSK